MEESKESMESMRAEEEEEICGGEEEGLLSSFPCPATSLDCALWSRLSVLACLYLSKIHLYRVYGITWPTALLVQVRGTELND